MQGQYLKKIKLPDSPGVYFFKAGNKIIYIGKATSLKDRVRSYFFVTTLKTSRGPLIVQMVEEANKIDYFKTDSVLEAIILEANLIKKYEPKYNTKEKDNKSFNYVVITKENFPRILVMRGRELLKESQKKAQVQVLGFPRSETRPDHSPDQFSDFPLKYYFGPFPNPTQLRLALKIIRKIFPFRDRCVPGQGRPCFNKQIGLCPGVCDGTVSKKEYGLTIRNIKLFFEGKKKQVIKNLEKEMKALAKEHKFEKAGEIKNKIFSLNHIQDVALIKSDQEKAQVQVLGFLSQTRPDHSLDQFPDQIYRIEAYDIAHLSGTNNVGVMVVWENGEIKKSEYRKFIIRDSKGSDVGALKEVLERRLKHVEWQMPNLIILDGGLAQLNAAKDIIKKYQGSTLMDAVAVVKNEFHKPKGILGEENIIKKYEGEILLMNSEAHRFAIKYHRSKRKIK